jgi:ATP-dependent helicase HepA
MNDPRFIPGQRWVSDTEPELGLGSVRQVQHRRVGIDFPASGEHRTYAIGNAPLTRVRFAPGDRIQDSEGRQLLVASVQEQAGLLDYHVQRDDRATERLPESRLCGSLQFSRPQERLLNGQLDQSLWFDLRHETLKHRQRLEQLPVLGLGGARTALLPHQLYIAHEVSRRPVPRVLLADEVGLGKTIEACLILHRLLLTGRVARVLIIVPPALLNQWLIELLRRFNLHFSLFDEERCQAIEDSGQSTNPFLAEQFVLCSLDLFGNTQKRHRQALEAGWDLLIVDEAHHLQWHEQQASEEYLLVETLAQRIRAVLLLTATPEQLGRAGHFARLRLLDPDRFHSLASFRREEALFEPVAEAVAQLLSGQPLAAAASDRLLRTIGEEQSLPLLLQLDRGDRQDSARAALITILLDRHGTGRVLFRNSRSRIKGFPARQLHRHPLPLPEAYQHVLQDPDIRASDRLTPETLYRKTPGRPWWRFDPRVDWLIGRVKKLQREKLLVICALAQTARELAEALRTLEGIPCGLFHEQMSILERDRAAAWFADPEGGCPLLICSEIGSEGRNFQFARHLVLFDLPLDPDLLEQRIGRLDRIGQQADIQIHVPHFEEGAQAVLLQWYHQGLDAFTRTSPAAHAIFRQLEPALLQSLEETQPDEDQLELLIETAHRLQREAGDRMKRGRDRLLEANSCREPEAGALRQALQREDERSCLPGYLERLLTAYGVEIEEHSAGNLILRPAAQMSCDSFPGLPPEGITGTFDRDTALLHEERQFLTWEHPMVTDVMRMLLDSGRGNACATAVRHAAVRAGSLMLELLFVIQCPAPRHLQAGRFLPPTLLRLLLDQQGNQQGGQLLRATLADSAIPLDRATAIKIIQPLRPHIQAMAAQAEQLAQAQRGPLISAALERLSLEFTAEIERLTALSRVNPNVRNEEISALEQQARELRVHIERAPLRLDAVQLIVGL